MTNRVGTPRPPVFIPARGVTTAEVVRATEPAQRTTPNVPLAPRRSSTPRDPAAQSVAPQASALATPATLGEVAARLSESSDPELKTAAAALRSVRGMLSVPRPVRIDLADDPRRPAALEGRIKRELKGQPGQQTLKVSFVPFDSQFSPFAIPTESAVGLPNYGTATFKTTRAPDGSRQFELSPHEGSLARALVADVVLENGKAYAVGRGLLSPFDKLPLVGGEALVGQAILASVEDGPSGARATVSRPLGNSAGPTAKFLQIATENGAELEFPAAALAEAKALLANPRIEGKDLTQLPFITIDNDDSMDLDQAMCLERRPGGGYTVHYAIADVAYFCPQGSALDKTAMRRSSTAYPPSGSIPLFPKELSEGLWSLLPDGPRRAFVVSVNLDANGKIEGETKFERGVIQSRGKLAYNGVQKWFDQGQKATPENKAFRDGLSLLKDIGGLLIEQSKQRGVVPSADLESRVHVQGDDVEITRRGRNQVELWNEQISLLVNAEVGKKLKNSGVTALHRVHPSPEPSRMTAFQSQVAALGVPMLADESLQQYAARLDRSDLRTAAIDRLMSRINKASGYSTEPGGHHALRLESYDHFTAPMRRYTDITTHRILAAVIEGTPVPYQGRDAAKLDKVVNRTEFAKRRDSGINDKCLDAATAAVLSKHLGERLEGVIVEVSPQGLLVSLQNPAIDVRVAASELNRISNGSHTLGASGVELQGPTGTYRLGTKIAVVANSADLQTGKSVVLPAP